MQWSAFDDPVHDAQRHFRRVLAAMAEPGTLHVCDGPLPPPGAVIGSAMWATLLSLCDLDTQVWVAPCLAGQGLCEALTFHTGARFTPVADKAHFAVVTPDVLMDPALMFGEGCEAYPDRSTTLIVALERLDDDGNWQLSGPGIAEHRRLDVGEAIPLMARLTINPRRFPLGLDAVLTCGERLAAIPRSTRIVSLSTREAGACMSQ
ncbi:MAG: phosphonate C-P lyase system protein PhnH [Pseudomonadota bacterium]